MNENNKINELVDTLAKIMKITTKSLLKSGAGDNYVIAKLLVTAAMHKHKDDFAPLNPSYQKDLKQLMHL